jgi:hypothetical protein
MGNKSKIICDFLESYSKVLFKAKSLWNRDSTVKLLSFLKPVDLYLRRSSSMFWKEEQNPKEKRSHGKMCAGIIYHMHFQACLE